MKRPNMVSITVLCGLIAIQNSYSAQRSKADIERDEKMLKAREGREQQQRAVKEQSSLSDVLKPYRTVLDSVSNKDQYQLADETKVPDNISYYLAISAGERLQRIELNKNRVQDLAKMLASTMNSPVNPSGSGKMRTEEGKATEVSNQKQSLALSADNLKKLKENNPVFLSSMPEKQPEIGMIGRLEELEVKQIVGPTDSIVERKWYTTSSRIRSINGRFEAGSVYQSQRTEKNSCWFWITGVKTSEIADGSTFTPTQVFQVTKTKTYDTAIGGTKTLFVLEPVDVFQYLKKK